MRVLELRLMHHWVTATAETMSSAQLAGVRDMWGVSVPQMAFEYEPLLHTLLALGAAHRATLLPNEASSLRPIHHSYIDSALQRHRPVTATLDGSTSESVCLNAVLISLYTLFLRSESSTEPYEPPLLWLSIARGIRTVFKDSYHILVQSKSRLCPLLLAQPTVWFQGPYKSPEKTFHFLLEYRRDEEVMDEKTERAYSETIHYLERLYISVQNEKPDWVIRKQFTGFPPVVPGDFLDFFYEKRPRALVILAYLFALAKKVENIWWLRGIPEREVRGINSILPPDWKWTMVWALNLVSEEKEAPKNGPIVPQPNWSMIDALY
ncbi:uncharacterized protein N7443_002212 [Penicillium atrosanguineum]|uniref:uncharacterized protein n=1 Tax=Penicillium atrosanguineum TaxID=1132637 RepID=UPI002385B2AC|nr:uncharacterized protein N7443_002212 [Penicillium atrosanguineum]KAJ5309751.1 hypothetical protein N7443_002212 [Penicillium atrosanguineum]